jgi:hypothetical protein
MGAAMNLLRTLMMTICCTLLCALCLQAAEPTVESQSVPPVAEQGEYHTPLAGDACKLNLFGKNIDVPVRDRCNTRAVALGVASFSPALGGDDALPLAVLYWRSESPHTSRTRLTFSVFVNELDHALKYDRFELLGHLENNTIPFPTTEIEEGREIKESSIRWGQVAAWLGAGYRLPVAPFQMDNDLRVQFFYEGGYLYSGRTKDTGSQVKLPPDTYTHGLRLRVRYDGMRRNLLELLHGGFAAGMDTEWSRRQKWSDANYGGGVLTKESTQEFAKLSGYLIAATPIPGLSERNRLVSSFHGGMLFRGGLDRFSLFRIGGGPFASETDDLSRSPYPGAQFNQFPASDYMLGNVEYRREIWPFLYLHLRGTLAWADRDLLSSPRSVENDADLGKAISLGLTSAFLWGSTVYLEYSHDNGFLRKDRPGDSALVLWTKSF